MRTLIKALFLSILFLLPASSCMQHNGNIGDFFGTWKLAEMTVDGVADPDYQGNFFFQFQTDVIRIAQVQPHNMARDHFGRWERQNDNLLLDFSYHLDYTSQFDAPAALHLVSGENILHIVSLSSRKMELTFQSADGKTIGFSLKKQ